MKFFHSIRWRLQLWHGLLLVVVLAGFGFTAWRLQRATQVQRVDQELQRRISVIVGALRRGDGTPGRPPPPLDHPPPPDRLADGDTPPPLEARLPARDLSLFEATTTAAFYYVAWGHDNREVARSATAPPGVPRPERILQAPNGRWRGTLRERFEFAPRGECILVGRDIRDELVAIQRFGWLLAGAGVVVLSLGLTGGWWISTRALHPIGAISTAAAKIATGDLTQRIRTADSESELGQLVGVLNSTFDRLDAAFAQQARFTADAAHELRTPVTVMLTHAQNGLDSDCGNEEHREAFAAGQRAAQRMRRLIESLLELARLDSGAAPSAREPCDLSRITSEAVELLRPLAEEQGIRLSVGLAPAWCEGKAEQLGQVVSNLVSNAIDYNRPGGRVQVTVAAEAEAAVLSVTDTGRGIGPEDLPHIFERFYRADQARSNAAGRSGLGLAIVKAIVETHGGTVQVVSEPGKGSAFTVRFPRVVPPASPGADRTALSLA